MSLRHRLRALIAGTGSGTVPGPGAPPRHDRGRPAAAPSEHPADDDDAEVTSDEEDDEEAANMFTTLDYMDGELDGEIR